MSVSKLGTILFSSFLIFATAPPASAQSTQDQTQDQTTKKKQKSTTNKETGKTTQKNAPAAENKAGSTQKTETDNSEPVATSVEDVKQIQIALIDLGYNPGEANGMMSSDTQLAIREFQYLNDLPVTGIVDEQTKTALDAQEEAQAR